MKNVKYIILLLVVMACKQANNTREHTRERTKEDIHQMLTAYHKAIEKDGLTAEFDYLDKSSSFFWVPPGYTSALSYDSVKTILETNAKTLRSVKLQWDTLQIFPLTHKIANYSGIVRSNTIDTSGTKSTVSILESGTLIKRKGGWKLLSGQSRLLATELRKE